MKPSGKKFGKFVKKYEKARRIYPREVFVFLKKLIRVEHPLILDLGCGTGISTRQLSKLGKVIGCDPDPVMIRYAKKHQNFGVKYVFGSAKNFLLETEPLMLLQLFQPFIGFMIKKAWQK